MGSLTSKIKILKSLTLGVGATEYVSVQNYSAGALAQGDVVILDKDNSTATKIAVTTTTSADDKLVFGMIDETIARYDYGKCLVKGTTSKLKVNGTADIAVGDHLSTYSVAKIAAYATALKGGAFAIALEAYATNDSAGVIDAYLTGAVGRFDAAITSAAGIVTDMAANGTATANVIGVKTGFAPADHVHKIGTHDHSGDTKGGTVAMGVVGSMAANGTAAANAAGIGTAPAAIDHVHLIGTHTHSSATTGATIGPTAFAADAFTADATGRAPFIDGWLTGAKLANGALAADATGRAKIAAGFFGAADATSRALFADDFMDATFCLAKIDDNAIPSSAVNWSYGAVGNIVAIEADASSAAGTNANVARVDHAHGITCGAPADGSLAAANAEGAATSFSRSDHAHRAAVIDAVEFEFGTSYDAVIGWQTGDVDNHSLVIGLGASRALHIAEKADIALDFNVAADTNPSLYIHAATTPITEYVKIWTDETDAHLLVMGTAGLDIEIPTSQTLGIQVNDVDEYTFDATNFTVAAANNIKFLGDTGIVDSAGNEAVFITAVGSAINYLNVRNAVTANPIILECLGTADKGFEFHNDQNEQILILTCVATAINEITITNAAAGLAPSVAATGETNVGLNLTTKGTGMLEILLGGDEVLAFHDAAITLAAATDTAGHALYLQTEDGGVDGGAGTGRAGAALEVRTGDGSAAATAAAVGGAGGALTLVTGVGLTGNTTGNGGVGGAVALTAGAGGASGAGAGVGGTGGSITLTAGAGGGAGGGVAGAPGKVAIGAGVLYLKRQTIDMADAEVILTLVPGTPTGTLMTGNLLMVDANSLSLEVLRLPHEADCDGIFVVVQNTGGETITLSNDAAGALLTIATGEVAYATCDGTTWRGSVGVV